MAAGCVRVCVFLSLCCALTCAEGGKVDEKCRHNLTKFDPYLSQYIGKRFAHTPFSRPDLSMPQQALRNQVVRSSHSVDWRTLSSGNVYSS